MFFRIRDIADERENGFGLIELLVGIVLFGILSAIAVGVYLKQKEKSADQEVLDTTRDIVTTIEEAKVYRTPDKISSFKTGNSSMPSTMNISFSPTNGGIGSVDLPSGVFSQVEDLTKGDYKITTYHYKRSKYDQANPYVFDSSKNTLSSVK